MENCDIFWYRHHNCRGHQCRCCMSVSNPLDTLSGCTNEPEQSFIFQDRSVGVTARHVRAHGAVAEQKVISRDSSHKSFQLSRKDSLPTYRSSSSNYSSPRTISTRSVSMRATPRIPIKISSPINDNPEQFGKFTTAPDLTVPNLAHHPAMYSDRV